MEYTMPYRSKILIDILMNKKKYVIVNPAVNEKRKKVTFNIFNEIEIIPNYDKMDYPDLWWSTSDLFTINQSAYFELQNFAKYNPT